jgi:flagellar biosynthesis GTPase FlhF
MENDHRRFAVFGKLDHSMAVALLVLVAISGSAEAAPAGSNRCPGERELTEVKRQARDELDRLEKALSMSQNALNKERADSEKFRKEKFELERAVSELKQRVGQLEKESAQKDKLAAATSQREQKARDANHALEKEKTEKDSLILDTAQRVQELEKESAAKDKQLAAGAQREKKEREKREKLEHDAEVAATRDRERQAWEATARAERDKLEALPPVPARIPEPVHCAVPEEIQAGADLFVRCVTQPAVRAKTLVFYYRPPQSPVYNALVMDPTKHGWSRAVITANKVSGKALQYYVEARDGRDTVAASNGSAGSPNVASIASSSSASR